MPSTDSRVVLAVVVLLGVFGLLGMGGLIWLVHSGADGNAVAIIAGPTGTAVGALAAVLATTRTVDASAVREQTLDEVRALDGA